MFVQNICQQQFNTTLKKIRISQVTDQRGKKKVVANKLVDGQVVKNIQHSSFTPL